MVTEQLFRMILCYTPMQLVDRVTESQTSPCRTSTPNAKKSTEPIAGPEWDSLARNQKLKVAPANEGECDDLMPNRHSSQLQEVSGILVLSSQDCHRRLYEGRKDANQAAR
jgi:hypothetical protein